MSKDPGVLTLGNVTLDCADPIKVATFWSAALGRSIDDGASDGFVSIGGDDRGQVGWFFIQVPEGKSVQNRVHFDLRAEDREAAVARLVELGGERKADHDENGAQWTVMLDVERNEFCVA
jgi:hypothetical protein